MPAQSYIQYSFHSGEWAPALNARVDLAKYHAAAELLENFFVDYRGGASSRAGTQYIIQCKDSAHAVRLITFQASFALGYILEFGNLYIRFIRDSAPVLETTKNITGITQANPAVVTSAAHGYSNGDWVYIASVGGMTQVNGKYYIVAGAAANTFQLHDLNGGNINSTGYSAYTAGGTVARIYTLVSPYAAADLALLKFTQDVDTLTICHPNYVPYILTFISNASWTISAISFGTSISPPTGVASDTTLAAGSVTYSYVITAVDESGQESVPSAATVLSGKQDLRTTAGSIRPNWTAVAGAAYYNVYKAQVSYFVEGVPPGSAYGFVGFVTGNTFIDSNVAQDFSITPPVAQNPFVGSGVISYTILGVGAYTAVPVVTVAPSGGISFATANAILHVQGTPTVGAGGAGYAVNDTISLGNGVIVVVNTVAAGAILTFKPIGTAPGYHGQLFSGSTPANPVAQVSTSGGGAGGTVNLVWGVGQVVPASPGAGYTSPPAVTFSPISASALAVLGPSSALNPTVPGLFQQRLVLAALAGAPQSFYMSQPGTTFNFNITNPVQGDNAISASLVAGQLNTIKSMVAINTGLLMFTDRAIWLISGGSTTEGNTVTPSNISANPHSYNGVSDVPPIVITDDILFVQAKGSVVRDAIYNIYSNSYKSTDISVLSSHLFFGYEVLGWAWSEEPFKTVWAIRDDGVALSLTFVKEQELIGWCHSVTEGDFTSVAVTIEGSDFGDIDAVYFIVERVINGNTVKYIERLAERFFPNGAEDAWCVDAGLQYDGAPATSFTGADHLAGATVTGLADGAVIDSFVMPVSGNFTLSVAASKVTVGLPFTPKLKTLALDINAGEGTVQGKDKKISGVTVRVQETLGLQIGSTFDDLVDMDDLVVGNVGSATNEVVTNLVTGDAKQIIDPKWTVEGQYCIQQSLPYPATILGVIPEVTVGDTPDSKK